VGEVPGVDAHELVCQSSVQFATEVAPARVEL
jgi:hypothetical protein